MALKLLNPIQQYQSLEEEIHNDVGLISTSSPACLGGLVCPTVAGTGSLAWQVGSTAFFLPFTISHQITVLGFGWQNAVTLSGNVDAGIYDLAGNKIVSTGSTVQAGVSALQTAACTATVVKPGAYFLALSVDNTTATFQVWTIYNVITFETFGVQKAVTNFPLAAGPVTFTNLVNSYIPNIFILLHGSGAL